MLLSIIIPVYNVELYLGECLDSVFAQDLTGCEVITVNDGSTDNSRQILTEYHRRYPGLHIFDQVNKGASAARNTGIRNAKGEFLYFLDSDDTLLTGVVSEIVQLIKTTDVEVIGFNALANGDTIYFPSCRVSDSVKTGIDYFVDFYKDNGFYPHVNVPLYIYRKSFLNSYNLTFKEGLYHEDILFTMYAFYYVKRICGYNILLYNYRQCRDGSCSMNIKEKNIHDRSNICRQLNVFFIKDGFFDRYFYNALFYQYLYNLQLSVLNDFSIKKSDFFSKEDKVIMKKGIISEYEYKLWVLSVYDVRIMNKFYNNSLPNAIRRFINILLSFTFKIQYNKDGNKR